MKGWRSDYGPGFSERQRRAILRRDPVCRLCDLAPSVEADHARCLAEGGENTLANGQGLCSPCHARKTAAETARGRARMSPLRAAEPHPGYR